MATQRIAVRIDLGSLADIETLGSVLADLVVLSSEANELQHRINRSEALRSAVRNLDLPLELIDPWLYDYPSRRWPAAFALLAARSDLSALGGAELNSRLEGLAREYRGDPAEEEVRVERLSYENPIDALLVVAVGGVALKLLRLVRDWSADRRLRQELVDDVADTMRARRELRQRLLDQVAAGELPVSEAWLDDLLKPSSVAAIERLSRRDFQINEEPPAPAA